MDKENLVNLQDISDIAIRTSQAMGGAGCTIRDGKREVKLRNHYSPGMLKIIEDAISIAVECGKEYLNRR